VAARALELKRTREIFDAPQGAPMSAEWMSRCVSDVMDNSTIAFTELGLLLPHVDLKGPNRVFSNVHAGGLGWAMPAALGAQLADRDRLVIACVGDGSYMFANPVACHQIAEALELPILTIIKNNRMWNAVRRSVIKGYPGGAAARMNAMPLTSLEPLPDFVQVARASRAHAAKIERGEDLPAALERAIEVIRTERRQVLLDLDVAATDTH
jgi:acetolactate synthase-1/2/3 large subunit